jgi:hypothetical protein
MVASAGKEVAPFPPARAFKDALAATQNVPGPGKLARQNYKTYRNNNHRRARQNQQRNPDQHDRPADHRNDDLSDSRHTIQPQSALDLADQPHIPLYCKLVPDATPSA